MATATPMRYLVKPTGWDTCPFSDSYRFTLEVVRRNLDKPGEPEEWAVCPYGFTSDGFTKKGKLVALRGASRVNRRHAIFDLPTAVDLAEALVEGRLETDQFMPLAVRMGGLGR